MRNFYTFNRHKIKCATQQFNTVAQLSSQCFNLYYYSHSVLIKVNITKIHDISCCKVILVSHVNMQNHTQYCMWPNNYPPTFEPNVGGNTDNMGHMQVDSCGPMITHPHLRLMWVGLKISQCANCLKFVHISVHSYIQFSSQLNCVWYKDGF